MKKKELATAAITCTLLGTNVFHSRYSAFEIVFFFFSRISGFFLQVGGCRFFDMKYLPEVEALFQDCRVTKVIVKSALEIFISKVLYRQAGSSGSC